MFDFHSALEKSTYKWKCLHQTLAPVLILSQSFGLIPVYGITASTPSNLNFKWVSLKVLHTFIILGGIIFCGFGFAMEFIDSVNFFSSSVWSLQNELKFADVGTWGYDPRFLHLGYGAIMINFFQLQSYFIHAR